ncbi:MAG TPA: SIMPL domain-containing protein [Acidimicrobiales bacterium]|nr:SIMPL domain-containing protein [Acidimicrobiales bacterium]
MNRSIILAITGGAVAATLITVGVIASVDDGAKPATAQNPPVSTSPTSTARSITVDGVGVVSGTPDTASVSLGVQVHAPTATEALDQASAKAQTLIDTLTAAGVAKADLQTSGVSLYPNSTGPGTVNGYAASNSVTAVVHDVSRAGAVIDAATRAVGDGVTLGSVWFSINDTSTLYAQAREKAVAEARTRAEQLAKAANVSVGGVVAMNESAQYLPVARDAISAGGAASTVPVATPIEPGRQELQLTVQVVFELVP